MNRNKSRLLLATLLTTLTAHSQKIHRFYTFDWKECDASHARFYSEAEKTDSGWHRVDFYVQGPTIQEDGWYEDTTWKVKHGRFIYAYPSKKIKQMGRYTHGKKEGLWMTWHYNGMLADSTVYNNGHRIGTSLAYYPDGMTQDSIVQRPDSTSVKVEWHSNGNPSSAGILAGDGKKIGKWQFWHDNGKLAAIELYDHDSLLQHQYYDEDGQPLDTARKDHEAIFKDGTKAWTKWLENHLSWPPNYKIVNGDQAVVVVTGLVDESGNITDLYISIPFFPPFEKEALNTIRRSPKWQPAIEHNRRVRYYFTQPIVFSQPEE